MFLSHLMTQKQVNAFYTPLKKIKTHFDTSHLFFVDDSLFWKHKTSSPKVYWFKCR